MNKREKNLIIITLVMITMCLIIFSKYIIDLHNMQRDLGERLAQLEVDYKIYEMNLSEIQENN